MREYFKIAAIGHESYSDSGNQYRLKITQAMEEINQVISAGAGVPLRTPQKTTNKTTVGLCYIGSSFRVVFQWLYNGTSLYNPTARGNFKEILAKRD